MVDMANFIKTASAYINKIKNNYESLMPPSADGTAQGKARLLAKKSAETAQKDYTASDKKLDDTYLNKYAVEVESLADQLVDDIADQLLQMLPQEIKGKIDIP